MSLAAPTAWADPTFNVSLNTSSISGTTGQVVFELIDGDGVVDNSLSLANFETIGPTRQRIIGFHVNNRSRPAIPRGSAREGRA